MKCFMYIDKYGAAGRTQEEEYKAAEGAFSEYILPGIKITFKRDVSPSDLKNNRPDIYLLDYGGMFVTDDMVDYYRDFIQAAEDLPNTLFLVWSSWGAIRIYEQLLKCELKRALQPNVILWDCSDKEIKAIQDWFKPQSDSWPAAATD